MNKSICYVCKYQMQKSSKHQPMIFKYLLAGAMGLCTLSAFAQPLISNPAVKKEVKADFEAKKKQLGFKLDLSKLPAPEQEALMFLYAYMPVGDVVDYPSAYSCDG